MNSDKVTFAMEGRLGIITLSRPDRGNACDPDLIGQLLDAARRASREAIGALLLRAEGANFCVGADLRHFAGSDQPIADDLRSMADGFHEALALIAELPVPVVGAVQGNAVGAGFGLALACDHLLIADDAKFATGYVRLGLSSDAGVSYFLTRALGERLARSLLIVPRTIGAAEAMTLGLADRIVDAGSLVQAARELAGKLAGGPAGAYAAIKRLTAAAHSRPLRDHLDQERDEIVALARDPAVAERMRAILG